MHTRQDWRARPPKKTLTFRPGQVRGVAVHYAGFTIDPTRPTDVLLRSIQTGHMDRLGWWDFAYNLAVDQDGEVWKGRGLDVRSGANGSGYLNRRWVAVVGLIGPGQPVSTDMMTGFRRAIAAARARWPGADDLVPHSSLKPTTCPGDTLRGLLADGSLDEAPTFPIVPPTLAHAGADPGPLGRGASGPDVARLQAALNITADGKFGPKTERRLREVQAVCRPWLGPVDGRAGTRTWQWVEWTERP